MVKRNACVVLLSNGKVGEINYFIWDKQSGDTFFVFEEILQYEQRPIPIQSKRDLITYREG